MQLKLGTHAFIVTAVTARQGTYEYLQYSCIRAHAYVLVPIELAASQAGIKKKEESLWQRDPFQIASSSKLMLGSKADYSMGLYSYNMAGRCTLAVCCVTRPDERVPFINCMPYHGH